MKKFLPICALALLSACATVPQKPVAKPFVVEQYELLMIEYTSPTSVDGIDGMGPADKVSECEHAGAAGVAQEPQFDKDHHDVYVPTCLPIVFKGPIHGGAVAVQPAASNLNVLFWASEAFDYDDHGKFLKGNQPQGPFKTRDECVADSVAHVKDAYATGKVAKSDSLVIYCIPIPKYGQQPDGSDSVKLQVWPGAALHCFWEGESSEPCEYEIDYRPEVTRG